MKNDPTSAPLFLLYICFGLLRRREYMSACGHLRPQTKSREKRYGYCFRIATSSVDRRLFIEFCLLPSSAAIRACAPKAISAQ